MKAKKLIPVLYRNQFFVFYLSLFFIRSILKRYRLSEGMIPQSIVQSSYRRSDFLTIALSQKYRSDICNDYLKKTVATIGVSYALKSKIFKSGAFVL